MSAAPLTPNSFLPFFIFLSLPERGIKGLYLSLILLTL
jgi:hypothetical protein